MAVALALLPSDRVAHHMALPPLQASLSSCEELNDHSYGRGSFQG